MNNRKNRKNKNKNSSRGRGGRSRGGRQNGGNYRKNKKTSFFYPEYLPRDVWTTLSESKDNKEMYYVGKLRIAPKSYNCAFVRPIGWTRDVFIEQAVNRNRTLNGDEVVVKIDPEDRWKSLSLSEDLNTDMATLNITSTSGESNGLWDCQFESSSPLEASEDSKMCAAEKRAVELRKQPTATVVAVKSYGTSWTSEIMGRLEMRRKGDSYAKFKPVDVRIPWLIAPSLNLPDAYRDDPFGDAGNEIYLCKIDFNWKATSMQPSVLPGSLRSLGECGNILNETKALLVSNGVDHGEFPEAVLKDLKQFLPDEEEGTSKEEERDDDVDLGVYASDTTWNIPKDEIEKRRDLRNKRIFSIDPTTAKDLDDALHITRIDKNTFEIGVHIADVSYFVNRGTELDREASTRCTSVYLVQRVIPMLPPLLCEQLCSLNPGVDRLAFSVIWKMKSDGTMVKGDRPWYGRTVIRSCCKLDYGTAQHMLDGTIKPSDTDISSDLWDLERRPSDGHTIEQVVNDVKFLGLVALNRRKKRFASGALALNKTKLSFVLDKKTCNPSGMRAYPIRKSNNLVEEYMLLANFLVAQRLLQAYGKDGPALLRNHPRPAPKPLEELRKICQQHNIHLDTGSAKSMQTSLEKLRSRVSSGGRFTQLDYDAVIGLLTRPMKQAQYLSAGGTETSGAWRHFALAIPYYTHFTSPIRRYADVLVHRLLDNALSLPRGTKPDVVTKASGYAVDQIAEYCGRCNEKKESAKEASMRSDKVYLCVYIRERGEPLNDQEGVVVGVGEKSLTILFPDLGLEERLLLSTFIPGVVQKTNFSEEQNELEVVTEVVHPDTKVKMSRKIKLGIFTRVTCVVDAKFTPPPCDIVVKMKVVD